MPSSNSVTNGQSEDMQSPATKSLVQLYEAKQDSSRPKPQSVRYVSKPGPSIRERTAVRPLARSTSSASVVSSKLQPRSVETSQIVPREEADTYHHPRPLPPTKLGSAWVDAVLQTSVQDVSRYSKTTPTGYSRSQPSSSSDSKDRLLRRTSQNLARAPVQSAKSFDRTTPRPIPRQISRERTRQLSTHMSVDSLANAMIASSLASSRVPSPTKSVPLPPPPRRHHFFHRNHSQELVARTPSPAKTMRQTMRRPPESDDETDDYKKGKRHLVRKHQHKHHEGDRKRYRTQVRERERKRYEGVWAANRGLLCAPGSSNAASTNEVLNIVVKDIWQRSRLPDDVLEEVWDLVVNSEDTDRLGREEFVVGLWLIDQRLKGNKLPVKVSESIWASVRRLPGIKVPTNKH